MAQIKVYTPKIGSKGQMTLPKEVRKILGLKKEDCLFLRVDSSGKIVLEKPVIILAAAYNQE